MQFFTVKVVISVTFSHAYKTSSNVKPNTKVGAWGTLQNISKVRSFSTGEHTHARARIATEGGSIILLV